MKLPSGGKAILALTLMLSALLPARAQIVGPGSALNLNSAQYAQVPANTNLTPSQLTFEAWVNPRTAKCNTILSRGDGGNNFTDYIFQVGYDGTTCGVMKVGFYGTGAWDSSTATVALNTWTHVAVTFDGTNKQFYINGVLDRTAPRSGSLYQSGSPMFIGRQGSVCNCNYFDGLLDEVRIWNVVRTPAQLQQNLNHSLTGTEAGLVAYYKMYEGGGSTLTNSASTGATFNGTCSGGPTWVSSGARFIPALTTGAATGISSASATLNATINPGNLPTSAWFQWGATTSYGSNTATNSLAATNAALNLSIALTGLSPATTYHFRIAATNSAGTNFGADQSFTTPTLFGSNNFGLTGLTDSSAAWGDFDSDGRLDILISGFDASGHAATQLWRNTGSRFTNMNAGLTAVGAASLAWGDYDRDGRLDILLSGVDTVGNPYTQVWRNTGTGFTNINAGLPGISFGSVAWGDYDNDGKLDILLSGEDASFNGIMQIWRNTGTGFTNINAGLPALTGASVAWGDYDNDGRLDILLSGSDTGGYSITQVWHNTGNGFSDINAGITGVWGSVAWGDYDNDGRLDILLTGYGPGGALVAEVWRNTGGGFTNINAGLTGLGSSAAWGDYDNDGLPDILLSGQDAGENPRLQVWRNTGSGFTNINAGLQGVKYSAATWGDFNNDGRLDVLLSGQDATTNVMTQIWQNGTPATNSPPTAPTGLSVALAGNTANLSWSASSDAQSGGGGLTYNVRVGTAPGAVDVLAPESDASGFRRVVRAGNAQNKLSKTLTGLPVGTYYWSVQAVDTAFAGSPFATEGQFTLAAPVSITAAASQMGGHSAVLNGTINANGAETMGWFEWGTSTNYGNNTATFLVPGGVAGAVAVSNTITGLSTLTLYNFRLVASNVLGVSYGTNRSFTTTAAAPTVVSQPATNITMTNATVLGSVAPNGADTSVWLQYGTTPSYGSTSAVTNVSGTNLAAVPVTAQLSNLAAGTVYYYAWVASNAIGTVTGPGQSFTTTPLFELQDFGIVGLGQAAVAWGDYDNDGRLDLLVSGVSGDGAITEVWRNTGSGFININAGLPGLSGPSVAWGDYDNDGRLDILLAGYTPGGPIAQVWRNTGSGFTNINAGLQGMFFGSAAWGDYDNDGRPDILLAGQDELGNPYTQIWRNTGTGFTNINAGLPPVVSGFAAWGDYDNDGRLDILVSGSTPIGPYSFIPMTQIWRNTGSGFTNINAGLDARVGGALAWGDYDNDGRLDILLAGRDSSYGLAAAEVWRNTGSGFSNLNVGLPGLFQSSVSWGDYDNDGRPDILITGQDTGSGATYTQIWRNTGTGFTNINAGLPGVFSTLGAAWGDYDNDGRLDLLLGNYNYPTYNSLVFRNQTPATNSAPTAPTALSATPGSNSVTLSWNASSDSQTPAAGLSYNLRIGTTPGGWDVVAPGSAPTGFRRLQQMGNAQMNHSAHFNLQPGHYYWSVQAIDSAFAGSPFAAEASFTIAGPVAVTGSASQITSTSAMLNGTVNPNGQNTVAWFQWGTDASYASNTAAVLISGTNVAPVAVSNLLNGLTPLTRYYYRLAASNNVSLSFGAGLSFITGTTTPPQFDQVSVQPGNNFVFQAEGQAGANYTLLVSTNLKNWTVLTNLSADGNGLFQFSTGPASNYPVRFFRLSSP
jgi:phosphodiesterase/alkaline phosphatase D-like protein